MDPKFQLPTEADLGDDQTLHMLDCACCTHEDGRAAKVAFVATTTPDGSDITIGLTCELHGGIFRPHSPEIIEMFRRLRTKHFEELGKRPEPAVA